MRGIPPRNGSHAIRPTMEVGSDFWKFFRGRRRLNARTRPNELGRREAADQRPPQSAKSPGNPGSCRLRERLLRMHLKKIARIRTIDGNGRLRLLEIYSGRRRLSARTRRNELARREAADQRPPQSAKSLGNPRSCRLGESLPRIARVRGGGRSQREPVSTCMLPCSAAINRADSAEW